MLDLDRFNHEGFEKSLSYLLGLRDLRCKSDLEFLEILENSNYEEKIILWNPNIFEYKNPIESCFYKASRNKDILFDRLNEFTGIGNRYLATVYSPRKFNPFNNEWSSQYVVVDKNYNVVYDPNPQNKNVRHYPLAPLIKYNGVINVIVIEKK